MKKIYGITETVLLILMGAWGIWFCLSDNYSWLMNEKFKFLSLAGFMILLLIGVVAIIHPHRRTGGNTIVFLLFFIFILAGKPLSNQNAGDMNMTTAMQAGMWDEVDQEKFPKTELQDLFSQADKDFLFKNEAFTTIGEVKRLDELDQEGSIAIMTNFMYCCVADLIGVGFRIPCENPDDFEDGQWIMVSGKLEKQLVEIELPNFRYRRAMISSLNKDYYIAADKIMTYDAIDQLPLLSEMIESTESGTLFKTALYETGIMEELKGDKQLTIFVPVDKAIEALQSPMDEMSKRELKRFVKKHLVKGRYPTHSLINVEELESIDNKKLDIHNENGKVTVQGSRLLFTNFEGRNGLIHFIYPALTNKKQ